jgi:hypothetical protein
MIRLSFLIASLVFVGFPQLPSTTDWRGLSPLKSTRMDVERTLGPPDQNTDNDHLTYYFPDVVVYFYFTSNSKCREKLPYTSWDVTADTLTGINVRLRRPLLLEETSIDLTKFKKVKGDFDMVNSYYYLSDDGSFAIDAGNNYISGYHYQPGSKQESLQCKAINQPR